MTRCGRISVFSGVHSAECALVFSGTHGAAEYAPVYNGTHLLPLVQFPTLIMPAGFVVYKVVK
jgi:hypothetical protein